MIAPLLTTDRLILRPYALPDYPAYAAFWTSARATHMGGPFNEIGAWESFCSEAGQWQIRGFGVWMLQHPQQGAAGLAGFNYPIRYDEPELIWALFDGFEGQGYATEAANCARRHGAEALGVDKTVSLVAERNPRSQRVAERLGASVETSYEDDDGPTLVYRHPTARGMQ